jgi:multidrug efflux pump subunit AcrB
MDIAKFSIKNKLLVYVLTIVAFAYGIMTYEKMGKLEDPEFTIKDALVITNYPGASAKEVEKEVTNRLEEAIQTLPFVKKIVSKSTTGQSIITVSMKDKYDKDTLPQVWDHLRKKINDTTAYLPPRASKPIVNDDFGDVYGVYFAVYGDEYSYDELKDYVDFLKKELILVDGVGKITTYGEQQRAIFIEFKKEKLAKLGINKEAILQELYLKNLISNYGKVDIGSERVFIKDKSFINSVESLSHIVIKGQNSNSQIFLKDVANIKDDYIEPSTTLLKYDNHKAIGLGISTISGGNVVDMGEKLDKKLASLESKKPLGIQIGVISHQAKSVKSAIDSFILNLIEAVGIVIVVLLLFMGLRSGLIIGFVLVVTILGSFIFMPSMGIMLERISLGALIIALGMLVDNAIVVVDGILVRINRGMEKTKAASEVVKQTALPLLAATTVAILAFGAIGLSEDATGEYTKSLFFVILISLYLSWITAITITPVLAIKFLKPTNKSGKDEYESIVYKVYGSILKYSINNRYKIVLISIAIFSISLFSFSYVKQNFFPDSTRNQILVDYILPQGSSIQTTQNAMEKIEKGINSIDGVEHITSFIGQGGLRFLLVYASENPNSAYGQMLIDIDTYENAGEIITKIEEYVKKEFSDINVFGKKFILGPGDGGKVQIKVFGDDLDKLREYEEKILSILRAEPKAKGIRSDYRDRVKVIRPIISDEKANLNGITRDDIAKAIIDTFEGRTVGVYRDGTELIPIVVKAPKEESSEIKNIENIQIFSPVANKMIPLRQIVNSYKTEFIDDIIYKYNRKRALTIHADPILGYLPNDMLFAIKDKVESISLDEGYHIEWHGEYKDSKDGQEPIMESLPMFVMLMILIVLALFNSLKKTLIIWLTVPFALIGVVIGLLSMDKAFGFMAMLGFLSLSGMLIKNAIVLIDEITYENEIEKKPLNNAIYKSGLSRLRAVAMAALTTALGMMPLLIDPFFSSMAVVIIFGLVIATMLTMILVPVFYAIFFKSENL